MSGRAAASALGLLGLVLVAASCPKKSEPAATPPPAAPAKEAALGLLLSGDVRGYLEPCGCSEHMLGGMDRAAAQVEVARKELGAAAHLDAGDALFSGARLSEAKAQQDLVKARTITQAFAGMDTLAQALGPRDLSSGAASLALLTPPYPLLGHVPGKEGSPLFVVAERGGIKVGAATGDDKAMLLGAVAQARAAGAEFVVALPQAPLKELVAWGPELARAGADLALVGHQPEDIGGDEERAVDSAIPLLSVKNRGRSLARLDLHKLEGAPPGFVPTASDESQQRELAARDAELASLKQRAHQAEGPLKAAMDKKIAEKQAQRDAFAAQKPAPPAGRSWFSHRFVDLSDEKPASTQVRSLIDRYSLEVGQINLSWARQHGHDCPAARKGEPAFIGTQECIACHADPGDVWEKTGHAHAYKTLVDKHKEFDLDCVRCHVIGVDKPGAVCRVDKVAGKENVGCESCHGPGSLHAEDPDKVAVPVQKPNEQNCRLCHTPENSVNFDYATYLPKILGPGHGKPLAKK